MKERPLPRFPKKQQRPNEPANKVDVDMKTLRAAVLREAVSAPKAQAKPERPSFPDGTKGVGILLLPDTKDIIEFWAFYERIRQSGLKIQLGAFRQASGRWTELPFDATLLSQPRKK